MGGKRGVRKTANCGGCARHARDRCGGLPPQVPAQANDRWGSGNVTGQVSGCLFMVRIVVNADLGQMRGDLTGRQALGRQTRSPCPRPWSAPLALADDLRLEPPVPVPWHHHLDRADLGLSAHTVAGVAAVLSGRVALVIAEMVGDLAFERRFQNPLGQLLQQATFAGPPKLSRQLPCECQPRPAMPHAGQNLAWLRPPVPRTACPERTPVQGILRP
jgi:hypothetical protein